MGSNTSPWCRDGGATRAACNNDSTFCFRVPIRRCPRAELSGSSVCPRQFDGLPTETRSEFSSALQARSTSPSVSRSSKHRRHLRLEDSESIHALVLQRRGANFESQVAQEQADVLVDRSNAAGGALSDTPRHPWGMFQSENYVAPKLLLRRGLELAGCVGRVAAIDRSAIPPRVKISPEFAKPKARDPQTPYPLRSVRFLRFRPAVLRHAAIDVITEIPARHSPRESARVHFVPRASLTTPATDVNQR
jgi:hypothetical protein